MKLYLLVEGKSELKIYPGWFSLLLPAFSKLDKFDDKSENGYFIISGLGYPHLLDEVLVNSVKDIKASNDYDFLVLVLDADECSSEERLKEVSNFIKKNRIKMGRVKLVVIIQNRCIETWLLGNTTFVKKLPSTQTMKEYKRFFDVRTQDPEEMGKLPEFNTHSQFHYDYLRETFKERNLSYSKSNPKEVVKKTYLNQLKSRVAKYPLHLSSFQTFLDFCRDVNSDL